MLCAAFIYLLPYLAGLFTANSGKASHNSASISMKWVVDKSSTLRVMGQSNVNRFTCQIASYVEQDTLTLVPSATGGSVKLNGSLQVDVQRFDCFNKLITSDLRKTLKAKEHPVLKVRFLSLEQAPQPGISCQLIKGWVEVELAGVKKVMQIPFEFGSTGTPITTMNGEKLFCFTDFKLSPPTKMAGVVKIKDEFVVDFRLRLKAIS
ncbi:MAG: hypothetical protein ACO1NX_10715 [Chitinophagaceae bacterium]